MKDRQKKPTGRTGSIVLDASNASFEQIAWPRSKPEIEDYVLRLALAAPGEVLAKLYGLVGTPVRNPESDFDYLLPTSRGEEYLDLTEFVPSFQRGDPYSSAKGWYLVADVAEAFWNSVDTKDSRYGRNRDTPVHLLAYTTHSAFELGHEVLNLLTAWYCARGTRFRSISYFRPFAIESGEVVEVFPHILFDVSSFDEISVRQTCVLLGDPGNFTVDSDGSVSIPISGPSARPPGRVVIQVGGTVVARRKSPAR